MNLSQVCARHSIRSASRATCGLERFAFTQTRSHFCGRNLRAVSRVSLISNCSRRKA